MSDNEEQGKTRSAAEVMSKVDNLTEEHIEKWEEFIDILNEGVEHVFGEGGAAVLVGLQFDGMGQDENLPLCVGTSNLPVCAARAAVDDLVEFIDAQHTEAHEHAVEDMLRGTEGRTVAERMNPENVPEELREQVAEFAEKFGIDPSQIQYVEVADAGDLADLPETEEPQQGDSEEKGEG